MDGEKTVKSLVKCKFFVKITMKTPPGSHQAPELQVLLGGTAPQASLWRGAHVAISRRRFEGINAGFFYGI